MQREGNTDSCRESIDYAAYMKSAAWDSVKARYRKSDRPQACVVCGAKRVDLHHRTYKRLGREHLSDLIPLCRTHHLAAHALVEAGAASLWIAHTRLVPPPTEVVEEYAGRKREGGWTVKTLGGAKSPGKRRRDRNRRAKRDRERVNAKLATWERGG